MFLPLLASMAVFNSQTGKGFKTSCNNRFFISFLYQTFVFFVLQCVWKSVSKRDCRPRWRSQTSKWSVYLKKIQSLLFNLQFSHGGGQLVNSCFYSPNSTQDCCFASSLLFWLLELPVVSKTSAGATWIMSKAIQYGCSTFFQPWL